MGKCCLNIVIGSTGPNPVSVPLESNYDEDGVFINYTFLYDEDSYIISYDETLSTWFFYSGIEIIAYYEGLDENCPESYGDDWVILGGTFKFILYGIACDINDNDIPADVDPPYCDVPCSNSNLLKKQKSALSKDIADISKREIFGLKCGDNWENIFMRSLIIDALSCVPYGVYSRDTEACLISKLTDKCNC